MRTFEEIAEFLTEAELKGLRKDVKKRIAKTYNELPETEAFKISAIAGTAKRNWYQRAGAVIDSFYGEDAKTFKGLLAGTSPRQTVEKNLLMTIKIFNKWRKAGKPLDEKSLNKLAKLSDLRARALNCKRAFRGEALQGIKVSNFYKNLIGDKQAVTLDTWMIIFADLKIAGFEKFNYFAYTAKIRETAKALNWEPCEVQETVWSYIYSKTQGVKVQDVPEFAELFTGNEAIKAEILRGAK